MAERVVTVEVGGKEFPAVPVKVTATTENFNEYVLEDGARLKVKLVLTEVRRVEGAKDNLGRPIYILLSKNVVDLQ